MFFKKHPDRTLILSEHYILGGSSVLFTASLLFALFGVNITTNKQILLTCFLIGGVFIYFTTIYYWYVTHNTDPGFIPKNSIQPEEMPHPRTGKMIKCLRCELCNVWRPPRAHHCRICKRCVIDLDHHCNFVGTCVAKNNIKYFRMYLISVECLATYYTSISFLIVHFVSTSNEHRGSTLLSWFTSTEQNSATRLHVLIIFLTLFIFTFCLCARSKFMGFVRTLSNKKNAVDHNF